MADRIVTAEEDWICSVHGTRNKWMCEIHGIACCYGTPCYECKREIQHPEIIERHENERPEVRERNSKPRYKKVISSNAG